MGPAFDSLLAHLLSCFYGDGEFLFLLLSLGKFWWAVVDQGLVGVGKRGTTTALLCLASSCYFILFGQSLASVWEMSGLSRFLSLGAKALDFRLGA
jgi:hypothetical protein